MGHEKHEQKNADFYRRLEPTRNENPGGIDADVSALCEKKSRPGAYFFGVAELGPLDRQDERGGPSRCDDRPGTPANERIAHSSSSSNPLLSVSGGRFSRPEDGGRGMLRGGCASPAFSKSGFSRMPSTSS